MSSLVVFTFPTQGGAQEVLGVVKQLQREQLIDLEDAAVVWREPDGKPKVRQATSLVGPGAWGGAFWGMLLGLLFFAPWLGLAIGAVTGAVAGKFADIGIDDKFIKRRRAEDPARHLGAVPAGAPGDDGPGARRAPAVPPGGAADLALRRAGGAAARGVRRRPGGRVRPGGPRHRRLSPVAGGPVVRERPRRNGGGTVRGASGSWPVPA